MDHSLLPTTGTDLTALMKDVAGQLAPSTRRLYMSDARHFAQWLDAQGLALADVTRTAFIAYRLHLADDRQQHGTAYSKATAARMLVVARRICREAVIHGVLATNPTEGVRGFAGAGDQETPHHALNKTEARALVDAIDRTTAKGKRDYALLLVLLRTGLRRSEAAALTLGDLSTEAGHTIATIRHGKGDKRRVIKVQVEAIRAIQAYLVAAGRKQAGPAAPLFVRFRKGDKPTNAALTGEAIRLLVEAYAKAAAIDRLSPHGLRASYVTLALEGGAKLQQVQWAAGHSDPRTTERYAKRRLNLDDNASDYVHF